MAEGKETPKAEPESVAMSEAGEAPPSENILLPVVEKKVEETAFPKSFKTIQQLLEGLEAEYRKIKATNLEDLHNELAEVVAKFINERKTTVDTVLLAIEILKHEMVTQKFRQLEQGIPIEKVL